MFSNWKVPGNVVDGKAQVSPRREKMPPAAPPKPEVSRTQQPKPEKSVSPRKPAQANDDTVVQKARNDAIKQRAEEMMKNASSTQRRAIEKAYKAAQRGEFEQEYVQKKNQVHQARKMLNEWLDGASEEERQAAVHFFGLLQKKNRQQGAPPAGSVKVDDVLKVLESTNLEKSSKPTQEKGLPQLDGQAKTKYIRINSPRARKNQWMYQTWHHMPPIHDNNPTANSSSHYVDARPPQHRHFTIHPDWGP